MQRSFKFLVMSIILVVLGFGCCSGGIKIPKSSATMVRETDSETVILAHSWRGETHTFCAGVWISRGIILTAGHCIRGLAQRMGEEQAIESGVPEELLEFGLVEVPKIPPESILVSFTTKEEMTGLHSEPSGIHLSRVLRLNSDNDLALLEAINVNGLVSHRVAQVALENEEIGNKLYIVGHPGGLGFTHIEGVVSAYRGNMNEPDEAQDAMYAGPFMQVSGSIWRGNSGGGAFNDRGELVGIASFMTGKNGAPNTSFFIPVEVIRGVLIGSRIIKANLK